MTGVARLHCLYLAGVSVVRCQIVFTVVVYLLSVSVFQVLKLFSPGRVSVYPCRVRTGLFSLPELETLHCRVYCTCTADDICTSTVFGVCTCTASLSHLHCVLELSNNLFSLAIGSRAFCTVTLRPRAKQRDSSPASVYLFFLFHWHPGTESPFGSLLMTSLSYFIQKPKWESENKPWSSELPIDEDQSHSSAVFCVGCSHLPRQMRYMGNANISNRSFNTFQENNNCVTVPHLLLLF